MGRTLRPYLPGMAFHITTRVAFRRHLIKSDASKEATCTILHETLRKTDAKLIAFCIMPNHMHLVVGQGNDPLWRLMQPALSRTARYLQQVHHIAGRIFGARYFAKPCSGPDYLRYVIIYNHLNPCRSGIVKEPGEYVWSSHSSYAGEPLTQAITRSIQPAASLYAEGASEVGSSAGYLRHLRYWRVFDAGKMLDENDERINPSATTGDLHWKEQYQSNGLGVQWRRPYRPDLRDIIGRIFALRLPGSDLNAVKGRYVSRLVGEVRREMINAARSAGHANVEIARFFCMSESRVSEIAAGRESRRGVRRTMESRARIME